MAASHAVALRVLDLRCPCCTEVVLDAVRALPGVGEAHLDFPSGCLDVELDPGVGSEASVGAAVSATGYRIEDNARARASGREARRIVEVSDHDLRPRPTKPRSWPRVQMARHRADRMTARE
jgi:hypothetical protein